MLTPTSSSSDTPPVHGAPDGDPLLHVHSPAVWGDAAVLVGTTAGLFALREAIDMALSAASGRSHGVAAVRATTGDGTPFPLVVVCDDSSGRWAVAALPYTDRPAVDGRPERIDPHARIGVPEVVEELGDLG